MLLSALSWIICGLVIGLIARAIVPGRQSIGMFMTILLGIAGAVVGGLIASAIWGTPADPMEADASRMWPGWLMSIAGATVLLWAFVALRGRSDRPAFAR